MVGVENVRGVVGVVLALGLSKISSLASNFPMHQSRWDRAPPTTQRPCRPWLLDGHRLISPTFSSQGSRKLWPRELWLASDHSMRMVWIEWAISETVSIIDVVTDGGIFCSRPVSASCPPIIEVIV